jgi:hypothetical protein
MMHAPAKKLGSALSATITASVAATLCGNVARADVTVQQQTSMSIGGMNIDVTSTERTSNDKQRRDSDTRCHGFLALFCRDVQSGEIVRLDKQLEWGLEPKKRLYTETTFPTPEQRALAQAEAQELVEQLKKCPPPAGVPVSAQTAPDMSQCQPATPQASVQQSDEHATVAGHDTRRTSIVLSQTCTEPKTGDVCDIDYGFDLWLTADDIPGTAERAAFTQKYLAAQGLDPNNPQLQGLMQQFMAPYADSLRQLRDQSSALKGSPLRTTFYVAFGGPRCNQAHQTQQTQQAQSSPQGAQRRHGLLGGLASSAVSGGLGGLFHHNVHIDTGSVAGQVGANAAEQTADTAANAAGAAAGNAAANATLSNAQSQGTTATVTGDKVRMVALTTETTAIDTTAIPADSFDLPAGWQLQPPPQGNAKQQFSCPSAGS